MTKLRATSVLRLGLVVAITIVGGVSWFVLGSTQEDERAIQLHKDADAPVASHVVALAHEVSQAEVSDSFTAEAEPTPESRRAAVENTVVSSAPLRAGNIIVRAHDSTRLGPLRWFNVRIANATRFAERRSGWLEGEVELPLTPGAYSLCVSSPGYEPTEIQSVDIPSGMIVRLDTIELRPGSGRIQVSTIGPSNVGQKLSIEVLGDGRHPCARCGVLDDSFLLARRADEAARKGAHATAVVDTRSSVDKAWTREGACPDCGYARAQSSARVHPGEGFVFANLAGGSYAVRLADPDGRTIGMPHQVMLEESATYSVVFDLSATRSLEIEVIDVDGRSLTQEWSRRIGGAQSNVEVVETAPSTRADDTFDFVIIDDRRERARVVLLPPALDGHRRVRPSSFSGRRLGRGAAKSTERGQPIDRVRRANDSLHPEASEPSFPAATVQCEIGEHGFVTMGPLPSAPLKLLVSDAHSLGDAPVPASHDTTRVRVYLHAR